MKRIKRLPPIAYVLLMIPLLPLFLIAALLAWLLGFWTCDGCERVYWITAERYDEYSGGYDLTEYHYCEKCNGGVRK